MADGTGAAEGVRRLAAALYARWRDGEPIDGLVADDVLILGPGADDVTVGRREPALQPHADEAGVLDAGHVRVGLADGGRSGWFWAFPGGLPAADGQAIDERFSGVVSRRDDDRWVADVVFLSRGLPNEKVPAYRLPTGPAAIGHEVAPGAEGLIDLLPESLLAGRLDLIARRPDVVIIGTDSREVFEGAEAYLSVFEPMREQIRELVAVSRFEFPGGIRAGITRDRQTGFVATNIIVRMPGSDMPTFRVILVFVRTEDGFRLACDHHAFPTVGP